MFIFETVEKKFDRSRTRQALQQAKGLGLIFLICFTVNVQAGFVTPMSGSVHCSTFNPFEWGKQLEKTVMEGLIIADRLNPPEGVLEVPPGHPESLTEFVSRILKTYSIEKNSNCADKRIQLRMAPKNWVYYSALQEAIAKFIPAENHRPTIDLVLSDSSEEQVRTTIGIAGGTGPLSDSELLGKIMKDLLNDSSQKKIDWKNFAINLYSAPPPRAATEAVFRPRYFTGMGDFASRGHNKYYLASNTAHLKINEFRWLVTEMTQLRPSRQIHSDPVVDLVHSVSTDAVKVKSKAEGPRVLILGTLQAFEKHLYPEYLLHEGMQESVKREEGATLGTGPLVGGFNVLESEERAKQLQALIDLAKSGKIEEAGNNISVFVQEEVAQIHARGGSVNKIILGCTELPLALNHRLLEHLKRTIQKKYGEHVEFINTETIFSRKIVSDIRFSVEVL